MADQFIDLKAIIEDFDNSPGHADTLLKNDTIFYTTFQPRSGGEEFSEVLLVARGSLFKSYRRKSGSVNISEDRGVTYRPVDEITLGIMEKNGGYLPSHVGRTFDNGFARLHKTRTLIIGRFGQLVEDDDDLINLDENVIVSMLWQGTASPSSAELKLTWLDEEKQWFLPDEVDQFPSAKKEEHKGFRETYDLYRKEQSYRFTRPTELLLKNTSDFKLTCLVDKNFTYNSRSSRVRGGSVVLQPSQLRGHQVEWASVKSLEIVDQVSVEPPDLPEFCEADEEASNCNYICLDARPPLSAAELEIMEKQWREKTERLSTAKRDLGTMVKSKAEAEAKGSSSE